MLKKVRVLLVFALTGMMAFGGCEQVSTVTKKAENSTQEIKSPITFTFYNADASQNMWSDPVAKEITKETGVTLETQYPSNNDNDESIALMIATGEYPDFIFAKGDAQQLIQKDALIDLSDLIDKYAPHIKKLYGDDYSSLQYSPSDKRIFQLASGLVQNKAWDVSGTAQLQWQVLKENNYQIPKTLISYTRMIQNYMQNHPKVNGKDTIGITICTSDWHWYTTLSDPAGYIANGSSNDGQWIVDDQDDVYYKHAAQGQKEYFQWLNEMYNEGILDPDFATQTYEDYLEKIASGRVLGLLDANWGYSEAERVLKANGQYELTYAGLPVTMNQNIKCAALQTQELAAGWGIGISKNCKDPVRAIKFLDWMCTQKAQILVNWGIEGVNYSYDKHGKRYRSKQEINDSETNPNYAEQTGVGSHAYPFPGYGNLAVDSTKNPYSLNTKEAVISQYNSAQKEAIKAWDVESLTDIFPQADQFSRTYYTPLWSKILPQEVVDIQKNLDSISQDKLVDCIMSPSDQFDEKWNELQTDLENAGLQEAEKRMTTLVQEEVASNKQKEADRQ